MHDGRRLITGLAVLAAAACTTGDDPTLATPPPVAAVHDAGGIVVDLCAARAAVDDPDAAADAFARSHGPLHDLAREIGDRDRQVAARLHEAKQQVEAAIASPSPSPPAQLAARLERLVDATRRGLEVLGVDAPPCPPSS